MSGYSHSQGNRSAAGKSDGRRKHTNAGHQPEWTQEPKTATGESLGSASSYQKTGSSLKGECTSNKMLDPHLQKESQLPSVKNGSSGTVTDNSKPKNYFQLVTDVSSGSASSHQEADSSLNGESTSKKLSSSTPKPVLDPHLQEESPLPPLKNASSGDSSQKADECSKQPKSVSTFDICPKKGNTGGIKLKPSLLVKNREKRYQNKLAAEGPNIQILRPGMLILRNYISFDDQVKIVKTCRDLGIGEGGFYQPGYRDGAKLHLKMMCLGKNWDPQSSEYNETRPIDNSKPPKIPDYFHDMVKRVLQDSNAHIQKTMRKNGREIIPSMLPDICIVNFYTKGGKLGLHQDKDESRESLYKGLPVVSFSIGDSAEFLYGDDRDIEKAEKVDLKSGDVLIFGGKSRHIFHGVTGIDPESAPKTLIEATNMTPGRLNLTFRQY